MSNAILVMGESGSGKSTSIRNLDPKSTFILSVLDKPLPFKGYKKKFNKELKNYYATDNYQVILKCIEAINTTRTEIKTLVIDDFQYILANEFMNRAHEKGFEKFTDIGTHAWQIIKALIDSREDLYCIVLSHTETDNFGKSKIKTIGKMLDDKVTLEGMFTIVLHTQVLNGAYYFLTQNDGAHCAKSPMGLFNERLIENDLSVVIDAVDAYYNEDVSQ